MRKRLYVSLLTYSFFVILFNIINGGFVLTEEMLLDIPAEHEKNVCGSFDVFLKKIEKALSVDIIERDGAVKILGEAPSVKRAGTVLKSLVELSERGSEINEQQVDYVLELCAGDQTQDILELDREIIARSITGKPIKPKTVGQKNYVDLIRSCMITFGVGPAGTGKTYLAMAMAIKAFKSGEVQRIILTRPAIEAGEKLGFLPGDLQQKIDPYLRPLYDALYSIMGADAFMANSEKGLIEVAPLAYMRGRTLDNAYIILDEAQNTTPAQMKMFLTRIGFNSKVIVTGDLTQKDLERDQQSGLEVALRVLRGIDGIGFSELTAADVVRHPLVQKIVKAYDEYEARQALREQNKKGRHKQS